MTADQINKSLITGELQLNLGNKLTHYVIALFPLSIPATFIFLEIKDYIEGRPKVWLTEVYLFMTIPIILSLVFYFIQRKKLKFIIINTSLTRNEIDTIVKEISQQFLWTIYINQEKAIIAKTHPSLFSGSWGEHITILIDKNKVLINSICDPAKRSSITSFGRNKKNVTLLIDRVNEANR